MKYGIISDIHSDIKSLNKVLDKFKEFGIEQIFCCGDMVGYGNFPDAVVKTVRVNNVISVAGNHEKALFFEDDYLDMNETAQKAINANLDFIGDDDLEYLKNLPNTVVQTNMRFVHGLPPSCYSNYFNYKLFSSLLSKIHNILCYLNNLGNKRFYEQVHYKNKSIFTVQV